MVEQLPGEVRDRLSNDLIDELLAGARTEEEVVGPGGLLAELTRRLVERAMDAELTEHLGYEPRQAPPDGAGNTRNGSLRVVAMAVRQSPPEAELCVRGRVRASSRRPTRRVASPFGRCCSSMLRAMMVVVYAFGVGVFAAAVMCCALAATLEAEDRRNALRLIRHPITSIFGEESADDAGQSGTDDY